MNKEKIAIALKSVLKYKISKGIIEGKNISRNHRELLTQAGWLTEILKGWYILSQPEGKDAVSVIWYESFWDFLKTYLNQRFKNNYCLSPVESLLFHSQANTIPTKINVYLSKSKKINATVNLKAVDTQLVIYNSSLANEAININGLNVLPTHIALSSLPSLSYDEHEVAIRALLRDPLIFDDTKKYIESNDKHVAKEKLSSFFNFEIPLSFTERSPAACRIENLWNDYSPIVNQFFSTKTFKFFDSFDKVDEHIEQQFNEDSYNSLTIEGYEVTPELVEKIHSGEIEFSISDSDTNKLAALGYSLAYNQVKNDILNNLDADDVNMPGIREWRMFLFKPMAEANDSNPNRMLQYRRDPVFIRGSRHVPVNDKSIIDCMDALEQCIESSKDDLPITRAILSHMLLVYIHPWSDGNGRTARFLMNYFLCKEKMHWLIIKNEERLEYFKALESAQADNDILPFMHFIGSKI